MKRCCPIVDRSKMDIFTFFYKMSTLETSPIGHKQKEKSMSNKFYVTTPIYYPSGRFHIGTAYTEVLADSMKRFHELKGEDTYFLTGTDEHGQKIQEKAQEEGITPQEYVDKMSDMAKELWAKMDIKYNKFIRTTEEQHVKVAQKIFDRFMEQGDIYKGEYEGWYCVPCETSVSYTHLTLPTILRV